MSSPETAAHKRSIISLGERERIILGKRSHEVTELPNLVSVQLDSFEKFLQTERIRQNKKPLNQGLEAMLRSCFPIVRSDGQLSLEYLHYSLDFSMIKHGEYECRSMGYTYTVPVRIRVNLIFNEIGEIRQKDVYIGDFPLMTKRGTFIINGAERVVVCQIHRSPGVIFFVEDGVYSSRIIPYRGTWLEFEIDNSADAVFVRIDRKRKLLATTFLRALGYKDSEEIIRRFYKIKKIPIKRGDDLEQKLQNELVGTRLGKSIEIGSLESSDDRLQLHCGRKLHPQDVKEIYQSTLESVEIVDSEHPESLHSEIILNCIDIEQSQHGSDNLDDSNAMYESALSAVLSSISPGDSVSVELAEKEIARVFFTVGNYDLGDVGRYKLNKRFGYSEDVQDRSLIPEDVISSIRYLVQVSIGEQSIDDIDHLSNRRIRTVGEMMSNQIKGAFTRLERIAKDRMNTKELDTLRPQDIISIKPIINSINEFFALSQLSQFMDQINPLAELTHKRRLNALGPGGLTRERAKFEVRDVHFTHYGRMCPIETPEGPNIGLITSLANYARVNDYGFLESPYRRVENGRATDTIEYLSAIDEERYFIAQADAELDEKNNFTAKSVEVRRAGYYTTRPVKEVQYMDVSPRQIVSVSAALIPFLEHDDANRALMGSNMQRQAVPLLFPVAPRIGTGFESRAALDSGAMIVSEQEGTVSYVSSERIEVTVNQKKAGEDTIQVYDLLKYQRSNQDTCLHQRPLVKLGQKVKANQPIADGTSTNGGELALGQNVLVGFMSWHGYNFEDAILISERVVRDDVFTSIHIKEFILEVRETKLGPEKITRDIPNSPVDALAHLDEDGVAYVGAKISSGGVLVGKVTPKSETESSPEFRLLNSIFGEKAREVRDTSLRLPHGVEGVVIGIQHITREMENELNPGVIEMIKVMIASKRKLKEGDKMAGRHGNKGVVARVLPIEDMPFLEDGTPLDVCLSPLGLPSRMNLGQILETQLGWAAVNLDRWYATPVFESPREHEIQEELKEAKLALNSKATVYDGLSGEKFENQVTVGWTYLLKLHHLIDDKMHARSTGPYSLVTQQPLGGKAQFGGQRLGEMEVWALEAYGAANTLQELLTIKSDDMQGRTRIYENIVKSEPLTEPGVPESFNVLVHELRGLGVDLKMYDEKERQIPLTERDEEMIAREGSDF